MLRRRWTFLRQAVETWTSISGIECGVVLRGERLRQMSTVRGFALVIGFYLFSYSNGLLGVARTWAGIPKYTQLSWTLAGLVLMFVELAELSTVAVIFPRNDLDEALRYPFTAWKRTRIATLGLCLIAGFASTFALTMTWKNQNIEQVSWWFAAVDSCLCLMIGALTAWASWSAAKWLLRRQPLARRTSKGPWRSVRASLAVGFLVELSAWVCNQFVALGGGSYPSPHTSAGQLIDAANSTAAGFQEEFLFCLLIPLAVCATGKPILVSVMISAVLRDVFHLYYGLPALFLLGWAFVAPWVVLRSGRIWGVVALHSMWDLQNALSTMFPKEWEYPCGVFWATMLIGFFCGALLLKDKYQSSKTLGLELGPRRTS